MTALNIFCLFVSITRVLIIPFVYRKMSATIFFLGGGGG